MALNRLSAAKDAFARDVARRTGLSLATVHAWVVIEGGPDDNPLNIASWVNGRRVFRGFGSTQRAVDETVRLLGTERYAPVLRVARNPNATVRHELWSIIDSPWEEEHYTYRGVRGAKLIGTYASLYPKRPASSTRTPSVGGPPTKEELEDLAAAVARGEIDADVLREQGFKVSGGIGNPLNALTGWVGDLTKWVGDKAALAVLYVLLSVLAAVVIVLGLLRATGTRPAQIGAAVAARRAPDDIPF